MTPVGQIPQVVEDIYARIQGREILERYISSGVKLSLGSLRKGDLDAFSAVCDAHDDGITLSFPGGELELNGKPVAGPILFDHQINEINVEKLPGDTAFKIFARDRGSEQLNTLTVNFRNHQSPEEAQEQVKKQVLNRIQGRKFFEDYLNNNQVELSVFAMSAQAIAAFSASCMTTSEGLCLDFGNAQLALGGKEVEGRIVLDGDIRAIGFSEGPGNSTIIAIADRRSGENSVVIVQQVPGYHPSQAEYTINSFSGKLTPYAKGTRYAVICRDDFTGAK